MITGRLWHAQFTVPPPADSDAGKYRRNVSLAVVGETILDAMAMVNCAYPGAVIWSIRHAGRVVHSGVSS